MMIDPQTVDTPPQSGGKIDPQVAHYMGPDQGPFACSNCSYFTQPTTCEVLSAPVDPGGVCNLFESGGGTGDAGASMKLGSPALLAAATQDLQGPQGGQGQ